MIFDNLTTHVRIITRVGYLDKFLAVVVETRLETYPQVHRVLISMPYHLPKSYTGNYPALDKILVSGAGEVITLRRQILDVLHTKGRDVK